MPRIGLISDTHSYLDPRVFHHFDKVDEIWHAGDVGAFSVIEELEKFKPLRGVYGNIDSSDVRKVFPLDQRFECGGMRILMTHIAGRIYVYEPRIRETMRENPPQILVCGHSHILKVAMDKRLNTLYINPGAAGKHGFHKVRTLLRFKIESGLISEMEVIELGPRASTKP
jgi:putative phosphoesterase